MSFVTNFGQHVTSGYYEGEELTEQNIKEACRYIARALIRDLQNNKEFYREWKHTRPNLSDRYYRSLVYYCCCALLDNYNYDGSTERECESVLLFGREILRVLKEKETDSPLKGGVAVWSRLGTVYQELGDRGKAIQEFREGIDVLTDLSDWQSGDLVGNESYFGAKYSKVEILYAKKGACHLEMGEYDQALDALNKALKSVNERGIGDMINESFPNGINNLVSRAKRRAA